MIVNRWVPKLSTSARWPARRSSRWVAAGIVSAKGRAMPYTTDDPRTATRIDTGGGSSV